MGGLRPARACLLVLAGCLATATPGHGAPLHDRTLSEVDALQDYDAATAALPRDRDQRPDWVEALRQSLIAPRETLTGKPRPPELLQPPAAGIVFQNTGEMPYVVFPHQPHSEWLTCTNCHDDLFERRATGRGEGMVAIFMGRHCGTCHGVVAFSPIGSCYRCHSQPKPGAMFSPVPDAALETPAVETTIPSEAPRESSRRRARDDIPLRQPSAPKPR